MVNNEIIAICLSVAETVWALLEQFIHEDPFICKFNWLLHEFTACAIAQCNWATWQFSRTIKKYKSISFLQLFTFCHWKIYYIDQYCNIKLKEFLTKLEINEWIELKWKNSFDRGEICKLVSGYNFLHAKCRYMIWREHVTPCALRTLHAIFFLSDWIKLIEYCIDMWIILYIILIIIFACDFPSFAIFHWSSLICVIFHMRFIRNVHLNLINSFIFFILLSHIIFPK